MYAYLSMHNKSLLQIYQYVLLSILSPLLVIDKQSIEVHMPKVRKVYICPMKQRDNHIIIHDNVISLHMGIGNTTLVLITPILAPVRSFPYQCEGAGRVDSKNLEWLLTALQSDKDPEAHILRLIFKLQRTHPSTQLPTRYFSSSRFCTTRGMQDNEITADAIASPHNTLPNENT